jgi:class 3 adenylate cyclase/tetratricopeptide (TPR) repeat protein
MRQRRGGSAMTFEEMLDQAIAMLQRRGRVTYRALKRQFQLDDDVLEDLKAEIIKAQRLAVDEDGEVLVWTGGPATAALLAGDQARALRAYTPPYLAEKILAAQSALEGERKQVTVLFADLKGSMELLADRDPEDARQVLDPVLERMMEAVHRYEGTVNQVMGDGIMALFGAPIAHEDHAARACYATLAMQEEIRRYAEEVRRSHGVTVQIRVGLNSGEVVVRAIENDLHMDYSAIGQTTHLAARMEQLATPGSVLLTAETLRLVEGLIEVTSLGPVPVKGLAAPVEVFELVGATPVRRRLQATAALGLTDFVGRHTELQTLVHALELASGGHGQIAALVGEPGVGKSRLVYEFLHASRTRDWLVLESTSVSYGKATPYFPVIDLFRRYFHIDEHDDAPTIREKVTRHLLTLDEALHETIPVFLSLFDVLPDDSPFRTLDPLQRRQRTREALKHVLLRESRVQPLLLVFEDLHWIDSETQALLDGLVESLPMARLLLLVNYRPEYQHGWGNKTYYTQLRLDPLPPESADALLQALLGDEGGLAPLKHLLIERTKGNPFFLEESVRTLVETQVLSGERGTYHLAQGLPTMPVPATVQAVLATRIDRLPPEEKRLLQTAAVISTEVPLGLLQAVADASEEALHVGLAHLQRAEFLYETHLFPEQVYTFAHALTHEVAYGSLLQERRRTLHARIVEAVEGRNHARLSEQLDRLAHHAFRGEVWEKAVPYCRQAGEKAYDRGAFREAVTSFVQAIDALGHLPETPDTGVIAIQLRHSLGAVLSLRGEYQRSLALLGEAEALARQFDDRAQLGQVLSRISWVRRTLGDLDGAIAAGRQALEVADTIGDPGVQMAASYRLGQVYYGIGDFGRAAESLRRNVERLAGRTPGPMGHLDWSSSQAWLALVLSELGEFAEGRRHGEEALRLATAEGRGDAPIVAHGGLGLLYLAQGDLEAAVRVLERGLALCHASGNRDWLRRISAGLGMAYAHAGRLTQGLTLLEETCRDDIDTGALFMYTNHLTQLSAVELIAGRLDEASQHACQALDLARQQKARGYEAHALFQLGAVHAHAVPADIQAIEAHYREALTLAEPLGMRPLQAHCRLGLGTLYTKISRPEQARAELSAAIELYRVMEMTFWLPQAEAALAKVEGR